jgi:hypothetical protein
MDSIFYDTPPHTTHCPIISEAKITKGNATWSTQKTLLGWNINTATMTLTLPPHRQTHLLELLHTFSSKHRISRTKWQQLLGELWSMALALSGANYHFLLLQNALIQQRGARIRITALLRQALKDWEALTLQLATPRALLSVVPRAPHVVTGCDASLNGMGGWLWLPESTGMVYLWNHPFPPAIRCQVVSHDNPTGNINNSELELAGIVMSAHIASSITNHPIL